MPKQLSMEEFIKKAKNTHGKKYNYSKVIYKNSVTKIQIICLKHGSFEQTPHGHLRGRGCIKCGHILRGNKKSLSSEEFINKAKKIHNNRYDYSRTTYKKKQH